MVGSGTAPCNAMQSRAVPAAAFPMHGPPVGVRSLHCHIANPRYGFHNAGSVPRFKSVECLKKQSFGPLPGQPLDERGKTYMQDGQSLHPLPVAEDVHVLGMARRGAAVGQRGDAVVRQRQAGSPARPAAARDRPWPAAAGPTVSAGSGGRRAGPWSGPACGASCR